jgi:hypothetical protein
MKEFSVLFNEFYLEFINNKNNKNNGRIEAIHCASEEGGFLQCIIGLSYTYSQNPIPEYPSNKLIFLTDSGQLSTLVGAHCSSLPPGHVH